MAIQFDLRDVDFKSLISAVPIGGMMRSYAARACALPFLLVAGSCSAGVEPPGYELAIVSSSPEAIEVWGRSQVPNAIGPKVSWASDQEIEDVAQRHCREHGRIAFRVSVRRTLWGMYDRIMEFHCIAGYEISD